MLVKMKWWSEYWWSWQGYWWLLINIYTGSASRGGDGLVRKLGDGNSPLNKIFDDQHIICRMMTLVTLMMTRWWEWWLLQRCHQERLAKPTDHQTSPNFTITMDLRLLQKKLSFPLHLTQIALKTIKISNITFSDFQHIWYIYHYNIFSILVY